MSSTPAESPRTVMLAADALGIASCPITLHREDAVATVLSLPEGARCRYAIALGYPAEDAAPGSIRRPETDERSGLPQPAW